MIVKTQIWSQTQKSTSF